MTIIESRRDGLPRIAIVGAGYMATEHVRALFGLAEIVGITSRSVDRTRMLAATTPNCIVFTSISEMYDRTHADGLIIAVPELQLPEVFHQAIAHPWVLLVEKPFGVDATATRSLTEVALSRNAQVYVALNRRHYASTRHVLTVLSQNPEPRVIEVQDQEDIRLAAQSGQPKEVTRNWMYANSIHLIDLISVFGRGEVIRNSNGIGWDSSAPFFVSAQFEFDSGDAASYSCVWNMPGPWTCAVTTSEARYEMRPIECLTIQKQGSRIREDVELNKIDSEFKPGIRRQAAEFLHAIRGEENLLPDLAAYARSIELVKLAYGLG